MSDEGYQLYRLLKQDTRYTLEAYQFVREALGYAQNVMKLGGAGSGSDIHGTGTKAATEERHMTGQQLCEAVRVYALDQYGYMAKTVLNNWGICSTGSIGDIVYNLIEISWMKKSTNDRREDFDDVYDFAVALETEFEISSDE